MYIHKYMNIYVYTYTYIGETLTLVTPLAVDNEKELPCTPAKTSSSVSGVETAILLPVTAFTEMTILMMMMMMMMFT
jgi:hypothetical protein